MGDGIKVPREMEARAGWLLGCGGDGFRGAYKSIFLSLIQLLISLVAIATRPVSPETRASSNFHIHTFVGSSNTSLLPASHNLGHSR